VKGTYCLVIELADRTSIRIGALGMRSLNAGVYVYVGSALAGIEQRVSRHAGKRKKKRWHIDYLLDKAEVVSVIAVPSRVKRTECTIAQTLLSSEGAQVPVEGFGSSDCDCRSHLIYFEREDAAWVAESVARAVAMLSCAYPFTTGFGRE